MSDCNDPMMYGIMGDNKPDKNDLILGTCKIELIMAFNGNDTVYAGGNRDTVHGGRGNDLIFGEGDIDDLRDYYGDNTLDGGEGDDWLTGGYGNDILLGQDGNDRLIDPWGGSNTLNGGAGNDTLIANLVFGQKSISDKQVLIGGLGEDSLVGGETADYFTYQSVNESNSVETDRIWNFEKGKDKIDLTGIEDISSINNLRISVGVNSTLVRDADPASDFAIRLMGSIALSVEDFVFAERALLIGTRNSEILNGTDKAETIYGHMGDDTIYAGEGHDYLSGAAGNDVVYGQDGNDTLFDYYGNNTLIGGEGRDFLRSRPLDADSSSPTTQILIGGGGLDRLMGHNHSIDIFKYEALSDSTYNVSDRISDFQKGQDKIDLSALTSIRGMQDLYISYSGAILIRDKDLTSDFAIRFTYGAFTLDDSDFIFAS